MGKGQVKNHGSTGWVDQLVILGMDHPHLQLRNPYNEFFEPLRNFRLTSLSPTKKNETMGVCSPQKRTHPSLVVKQQSRTLVVGS